MLRTPTWKLFGKVIGKKVLVIKLIWELHTFNLFIICRNDVFRALVDFETGGAKIA
jgi:hypothetical protein